MRVLWWCLSSSLVAAGSAALALVPEPSEAHDTEEPVAAALAAPSSRADPVMRLPIVPRSRACAAPEPVLLAPEAEDAPRAAALEASLLVARQELADARAELETVRARLQQTENQLEELLELHCQERFDRELDAWLDGSLAPFHEGDERLRGQLRTALATAAGAPSGRGCVRVRRIDSVDCPEEVAMLRLRIPDGVVAQLAGLYRGWEAERAVRPRILMGCGNSATVTVEDRGQQTQWLRDDPYVRFLIDERMRIAHEWQRRINTLLGVDVHDLD